MIVRCLSPKLRIIGLSNCIGCCSPSTLIMKLVAALAPEEDGIGVAPGTTRGSKLVTTTHTGPIVKSSQTGHKGIGDSAGILNDNANIGYGCVGRTIKHSRV